jgi:hypothetical protein
VWRLGATVLAAVACAASAGCGEGESGAESARYLDPRSEAVVAVDLDYGGDNWQQIKRLYARAIQEGDVEAGGFTPPTLDGALGALASSAGLSFADDIRPLLGGTAYVGVRVEPAPPPSAAARDVLERLDTRATRWDDAGRPQYFGYDGKPLRGVSRDQVDDALREQEQRDTSETATAVYRVEDADALGRVLDKLRGQGLEAQPIEGVEDARRLARGVALLGGDTLVAVVDDDDGESDRLLRERLTASGEGPDLPELEQDFVAARAAPTLLGAWLDRDELGRALRTAAGRALRGAEARIRLERDAARASARVEFDGLAPEELPLSEPGPLALPPGEGIVSASANQSLTTVFLARLARELYPDSRFVRRVERLEQSEGLRFEDEVLRQFAGLSFTVLRPEGADDVEFGARSTLRDPAAMRVLLPRIAPELPGILEALQGLGSTGLTGLLFVAPDAPLTPAAFGLLAAVRVSRLPGGATEELYEVTGLDSSGARPGPDRVVYGLIGDAFVVASSEELAREVAAMSTEPAPEAATRLRVDLTRLLRQVAAEFGSDEDVRVLRVLLAGADASASAQDGDVVAEAELRWAR